MRKFVVMDKHRTQRFDILNIFIFGVMEGVDMMRKNIFILFAAVGLMQNAHPMSRTLMKSGMQKNVEPLREDNTKKNERLSKDSQSVCKKVYGMMYFFSKKTEVSPFQSSEEQWESRLSFYKEDLMPMMQECLKKELEGHVYTEEESQRLREDLNGKAYMQIMREYSINY